VSWIVECIITTARNRSIDIPVDLETQLNTMFSKSQIMMKHSKHWISAGKIRLDTTSQQTQDYRNIIDGLQVCVTNHSWHILCFSKSFVFKLVFICCLYGNIITLFQILFQDITLVAYLYLYIYL